MRSDCLLLLTAGLPLFAACGQPGPIGLGGELASSRQAIQVENGRELNGRELNGRELNGRELNGRELNGRELNGRELNGRELNGRELNGRELNGRELNGRELNGRELSSGRLGGLAVRVRLEGSELVGDAEDGRTLRGQELAGVVFTLDYLLQVRIDSVERDSAQLDLWRYQVALVDGDSWQPVCGWSNGTRLTAIPLAGLWNYHFGAPGGGSHLDVAGAITFACAGGALAKCVELGYAPWRALSVCAPGQTCQQTSLAEHHQACTRMLRADYCGDGISLTRDGTLINVYDGVGLQADTDNWAFEAEWQSAGAVCVDHRRRAPQSLGPNCPASLHTDDCGDLAHFATGTLIMTEGSPLH